MTNIAFLHHSTGNSIWVGNTNRYVYKLFKKGDVERIFSDFNRKNRTDYRITEISFPKASPYGWNNYPYDYYNIWVRNAGANLYMEEPTLEILTQKYDIIIFKHCYPVSRISEDIGIADANSPEKRLENYKVQYNALKEKMHQFPENKFIVWTPAVCTKKKMTEDEAKRTFRFYKWIMEEWKEEGDNIFIWDFYKYETEGTLYLLDKYATSPDNPHPGRELSARLAGVFSKYIFDVIETPVNLKGNL